MVRELSELLSEVVKTWILVIFFVFHFISLHHFANGPLVIKLQFGSCFLDACWFWGS